MTPEWLIWYGLHLGISYPAIQAVPFGELLDLVAVEQIQNGVAREKAEDDFFDLLKRR